MRIVSLLPSATEIVYALGLADYLCAVTVECDFPAEARSKRVVSRSSVPDVDGAAPAEIDRAVRDKLAAGDFLYEIDDVALREIQPDLILAQDLCRVCAVPSGQVADALEVIGCRSDVISLDPGSLEDIVRGIEQVGEATDRVNEARRLATDLRGRIDAVRAAADDLEPVRTLAVEWLEPLFVGGHWVPEMIEVAGGIDVANVPGKPSRRLHWDEVETGAPEVAVYMPCGYGLADALAQAPALWDEPAFAATPAARCGRVYATDASAYFSRPGPRIVDGLEILAWALHPDVFAQPPTGRVVVVV